MEHLRSPFTLASICTKRGFVILPIPSLWILSGRGEKCESSDMGHGRPGKVSGDHQRLLQGSPRSPPGVRCYEAGVLGECETVAQGTEGPCRPQHCHHADREQDRPEAPEGCFHRSCPELCREGRAVAHRDIGPRGNQRREGFHDHSLGDPQDRQQEVSLLRRALKYVCQGRQDDPSGHRQRVGASQDEETLLLFLLKGHSIAEHNSHFESPAWLPARAIKCLGLIWFNPSSMAASYFLFDVGAGAYLRVWFRTTEWLLICHRWFVLARSDRDLT